MNLSGRVAFVTGGGRGIGRAISLALAGAGADLVLVARTASELAETAELVQKCGRRSVQCIADVSRRMEVDRAVRQGLQSFGRADILINNAAVQAPIGPLAENDPETWTRTVAVNLFGTFHCIQAVLPGMLARRQGKIINLSGGGATGPRPGFSAYAASKAAVVRLTETLAEELRPYNVQVNAVAPGALNTRMLDEVLATGSLAGRELEAARNREREGGTPIHLVTELVLFLASDASGGLTGKLISAPHDDWRSWDAARIAALTESAWYSLRRIDPHTIGPLVGQLAE